MDININLELLYFMEKYLANNKNTFEKLTNAVSNLQISCSELTTLGNLEEVKKSVFLLKDIYDNTSLRINNIKQVFVKNDEAAYRLFTYLDGKLDDVFANYMDGSEFNYVVDVDKLLDIYINSSLRRLKTEKGTYNMYYYKEYTKITEDGEIIFDGEKYTSDLLEYIQSNYSGREAAVNSALVILQLAADRGVKYPYTHKGTNGSEIETSTAHVLSGVDCNAFVSWFIAQGNKNDFQWKSCESFQKSGSKIDFSSGQPGDIFINELKSGNGAHVGVIIRNDVERGVFIVAESSSDAQKKGIVLCERSYSELDEKGYHIRDMEEFYD